MSDFRLRESSVGDEAKVEILFPDKPDEGIRAELKGAGFRFYRPGACWYGPRANLPERYQSAEIGPAELEPASASQR
jgi:hypothetical protein